MAMEAKKDDMKKLVDILRDACIVSPDYSGKVTLHFHMGQIAGLQLDTMIKPR